MSSGSFSRLAGEKLGFYSIVVDKDQSALILLVLYYLLNKISAVGVGLFLTHVIQIFPITPEGCQVQKTKFIEIDVISKMFLANKIFFFSPNCSFLYRHASAVSVMQFLQ